MNDAIYIDTRPGRPGLFSPPRPVPDYAAWLSACYEAGHVHSGGRILYLGIAQRLNAITNAVANGNIEVLAHGPYAGAAAATIESLTRGIVRVEVLA